MLLPGSLFAGRYRVTRALKSGAMGWVYVAEHVGTSQRVALKLMRPDLVASPELHAKFAQEARVAAMIQSRHVVAVTDSGVEASVPFLVMELLEGQELGEVLAARGPLAPPLVACVLGQLAKGLDKAHGAGVIHRDLKPENVFLTRDEDGELVVKILDFGIAKIVQAASASTVAGGTPLYMAPEQTVMGPLTPAVDVWALGLIAFRMLAGKPYWHATSLGELYGEIVAGTYPAASARSPVTLPAGFDAAFARCVVHDPGARFSSAGEAAKAISSALGSPLVSALDAARALLEAPSTAAPIEPAPATERISTGAAGASSATPRETPAPVVGAVSAIATSAAPVRRRTPLSRRWVFVATVLIGLAALVTFRLTTHGLSDFSDQTGGKKPAKKVATSAAPVAESLTVPSVAPDPPPPPIASSIPANTPPPGVDTFGVPTTAPPPPASTSRPPPPPDCSFCKHRQKPRICQERCMAGQVKQ